jgi:hypothetical protein
MTIYTMILKALIPAVLGTTLLFSCTDKQKTVAKDTTYTSFPGTSGSTTEDKKEAEPEKEMEIPKFGGAQASDSLYFKLRRTPCFGRCKVYEINVYRSGYATFNGHSNVELEGMHQGRVGMDTLITILTQAEKIDFFSLEDRYDNEGITDLPSTIIQISANGKNKKVVSRVGTPEALKSYIAMVEELLYPMPWRPVPKAE